MRKSYRVLHTVLYLDICHPVFDRKWSLLVIKWTLFGNKATFCSLPSRIPSAQKKKKKIPQLSNWSLANWIFSSPSSSSPFNFVVESKWKLTFLVFTICHKKGLNTECLVLKIENFFLSRNGSYREVANQMFWLAFEKGLVPKLFCFKKSRR